MNRVSKLKHTTMAAVAMHQKYHNAYRELAAVEVSMLLDLLRMLGYKVSICDNTCEVTATKDDSVNRFDIHVVNMNDVSSYLTNTLLKPIKITNMTKAESIVVLTLTDLNMDDGGRELMECIMSYYHQRLRLIPNKDRLKMFIINGYVVCE